MPHATRADWSVRVAFRLDEERVMAIGDRLPGLGVTPEPLALPTAPTDASVPAAPSLAGNPPAPVASDGVTEGDDGAGAAAAAGARDLVAGRASSPLAASPPDDPAEGTPAYYLAHKGDAENPVMQGLSSMKGLTGDNQRATYYSDLRSSGTDADVTTDLTRREGLYAKHIASDPAVPNDPYSEYKATDVGSKRLSTLLDGETDLDPDKKKELLKKYADSQRGTGRKTPDAQLQEINELAGKATTDKPISEVLDEHLLTVGDVNPATRGGSTRGHFGPRDVKKEVYPTQIERDAALTAANKYYAKEEKGILAEFKAERDEKFDDGLTLQELFLRASQKTPMDEAEVLSYADDIAQIDKDQEEALQGLEAKVLDALDDPNELESLTGDYKASKAALHAARVKKLKNEKDLEGEKSLFDKTKKVAGDVGDVLAAPGKVLDTVAGFVKSWDSVFNPFAAEHLAQTKAISDRLHAQKKELMGAHDKRQQNLTMEKMKPGEVYHSKPIEGGAGKALADGSSVAKKYLEKKEKGSGRKDKINDLQEENQLAQAMRQQDRNGMKV